MVSVNGHQLNGFYSNGHTLHCSSDYERRPAIDVTPTAPKPGWRNQFAVFTHNLSWLDADGCSHSMTLRSDSLPDLLADLKALKAMIKAAKQQHQAQQPAAQPEPDSDIPPCKIHGTPMMRRQSKRTGGIYFSHKLTNGELCFGLEKKA